MTKLELINLALGQVGANRIAALSDTSNEAVTALAVFDPALHEALKLAPWSFASKWEELAASPSSPVFPALTSFELPDCTVKVWQVSDGTQDYGIEWKTGEHGTILVDASACWALVTREVDFDTDDIGLDFAVAVAYRLASLVCVPLSENIGREEKLIALYERQIRLAAIRDGKQGSPERIAPAYQKPGRITSSRY